MKMANPRDDVNSSNSSIGVNGMLNGEFYLNERTGRTHVRLPAGGAGGGITSYADVPATEEQHVGFLKAQADAKKAEGEALHEQHAKADEKLKKHQAKADEEAKKQESADKDAEDNGDKPYVGNPITDQTYGRPRQDPPGLENQTGPINPADGRDFTGPQLKMEPTMQPDPNAHEPMPAA
jgi:hypothetical protein